MALFGLCVVLLSSYIIYYRHFHPLSRFPGPLLASISNGYKLWATVTDCIPNEMERLHATYGSVVRIGPNDLSFNSAAALETIYKSRWPKGHFYVAFHAVKPAGLFAEQDIEVIAPTQGNL
jgi:hypothetical protein